MTRMLRNSPFRLALVAPLMTLVCFGCGPDPKDQKIVDLTAERDGLQRELDDRDRQLGDAMVREDDAQRTIDDLNQHLAKMRAEGGKIKDVDGWITMPGFDMISIPGSVLFSSGNATLTSGGRRALDRIAADVRARYNDRDIYVFGHTDNEPIRKSKWKDNWELGAMRALNVVRHLRGSGIPEEHLVQANCGPFRPRSSNINGDGKRQNRRVEFYAVDRKGGLLRSTAARPFDD